MTMEKLISGGHLQRLIEEKFGVTTGTYLNRLVTQIPATAGKIVQADPERVAFLIVNLGTTNAFILPEPDVASSKGIRLDANGGYYRAVWDEDFALTGYDWYGVSSSATNCLILEVIVI